MVWSRTSRHERGYGSTWDKLRVLVMRRDKSLCQPCLTNNRTELATEVDHITAKAKGGLDELDNLQAICTACHREKTAHETAEAQGRTYKPKPEIGHDGWPKSP